MKQLTIRGVDAELHQLISKKAAQQGMSMNGYLLHLIRQSLGLNNGGKLPDSEFDDLDHLAGSWSQEDFEEFSGQLQLQRSIDNKLWE